MISVKVFRKDESDKVLAELQRKQLSFVTQGGQMIQAEMKSRTPVRTGNLRNSEITEAFVEDGKAVSETGPTAEYAEHVEYGTVKQDAQPYAEPGFQAAYRQLPALALKVMKVV